MNKIFSKAKWPDIFILSGFIIFVTFHPYFLHGKINIYEIGLYLPGINALFHGLVPYRDFFHLRGPFELYMPAGLMSIFGVNMATLSVYFYGGTIITLIVCVLIAKELYKTKFILYLFVPVLVARTFPRVVFTYWGGVRYALGLLAVLFAIKFFKKERPFWIFLAGLASIGGLLTSVEIGVYAVGGITAALIFSFFFRLQDRNVIYRAVIAYTAGVAVVALPYFLYLLATNSLFPFVDAMYAVIVNKETIINQHLVSEIPSNLFEAVRAMTNPLAKNFRHMTPAYLYIILLGYLIVRARNKTLTRESAAIVCVGIYGIIMYNTAFRGIWAAQFEMALQPEKILFFLMLEEVVLFLREKMSGLRLEPLKVFAIIFFFIILAGTSLGYSFDRYGKRFYVFRYIKSMLAGKDVEKLMPLYGVESKVLTLERAKGMVVPKEQADELEAIAGFFARHTSPNDSVLTYPELGTYNFLVDRPFVGRFPIATFSWFNDQWHEEFISDIKSVRPKFIVLIKEFPVNWQEVYLGAEKNRKMYRDAVRIINEDYKLQTTTPGSYIFARRE